ncbi:MAG: hypothetical protein JOZ41_09000 [Chloroflexi bacterium]|nr:hypothetical protein [Chloroflexota bacterium]
MAERRNDETAEEHVDEPPEHEGRTISPLVVALILLALLATAIIGFFVTFAPGASSSSRPASTVGTAASASTVAPTSRSLLLPRKAGREAAPRTPTPGTRRGAAVPAPATVWTFPGLTAHADQVMLTLSNQNRVPVAVQLRMSPPASPSMNRLVVPPRSGQELGLDPSAVAGPLVIRAQGPIVVARLVINNNHVQFTYGTPGPSTTGAGTR